MALRAPGWREPDRGDFRAPLGAELPMPPLELRELVGLTDPAHFDNPARGAVYPYLPTESLGHVLDFGCGCGRLARRLIQQRPQPASYLGIDLHRGMIKWCRLHLAPLAPGFRFEHHDVFNAGLNPGEEKPRKLPLPAGDATFTFVEAWSIFTHLIEAQAEHYLHECARVLRPDGVLQTTWFLFDKADFPMMQDFQNALYINTLDPTNAVIYDRAWLRAKAREAGLVMFRMFPPPVRGYQCRLLFARAESGRREVEFPPDSARVERHPPPLLREGAAELGLGSTG
jgi:SAM-dependent methyltransferase